MYVLRCVVQVADRALDESEKIETDMDIMLGFFSGPDGSPNVRHPKPFYHPENGAHSLTVE